MKEFMYNITVREYFFDSYENTFLLPEDINRGDHHSFNLQGVGGISEAGWPKKSSCHVSRFFIFMTYAPNRVHLEQSLAVNPWNSLPAA